MMTIPRFCGPCSGIYKNVDHHSLKEVGSAGSISLASGTAWLKPCELLLTLVAAMYSHCSLITLTRASAQTIVSSASWRTTALQKLRSISGFSLGPFTLALQRQLHVKTNASSERQNSRNTSLCLTARDVLYDATPLSVSFYIYIYDCAYGTSFACVKNSISNCTSNP